MKRNLGKSGIDVSALGMGCWAIGGPWWWVGDGLENISPSGWGQTDDVESIRAVQAAIDLGVNFFDTADVYGCGHSERVLGKAIAGKRDQVVIATKFSKQFDEDKKHYFGHQTSPELIREACEASLRRLNTDVIDLYQFHWGDYEGDAIEVRDTLEELVNQGKIRSYGWSTDDTERARIFAQGGHCTAIQHTLHVARDTPEMLALCEQFDQASINRGPLAMGILTGKFDTETTFPEDDIRHGWDFSEGRIGEILTQLAAVREILTSDGRTLAQGALGWIWARSDRTIPIPGFKSVEQIEENAKAIQLGPLTRADLKEIDQLLGRGNPE